MLTVRQFSSSACEPVRDVDGLNRSKPIVLESRLSRVRPYTYAVLRVDAVRFDQKVLAIFLALLIEGISPVS